MTPPRRYSTPIAFRQALEQRLRTFAQEEGRDLARVRQLVIFDRFLARASRLFEDRMVLKGGLVVELRIDRARTTKDVDLRLLGDPDDVLRELQEAGRLDLGDFLRFEVREDAKLPEIRAEGPAYPGRRYRAEAKLAGKLYGFPFGVDIAFAEPLTGKVEEIPGSDFLSFAGIEPTTIRIYPLETHIAEKLHAYTLPRNRPNSRVKDLPDIALLASCRVIEGAVLIEAMERTFEARNTHPAPSSLPSPPPLWVDVYARIAEQDGLAWPTLEILTEAVAKFLDPVLETPHPIVGSSELDLELRKVTERIVGTQTSTRTSAGPSRPRSR